MGIRSFRWVPAIVAIALVSACARDLSFSANPSSASSVVQALSTGDTPSTAVKVAYSGDCPTTDLRSSAMNVELPAIQVSATAIAYDLFDSTTPQEYGETGTAFCPVILLLPAGTASVAIRASASWTYDEWASTTYNASGDPQATDNPVANYARDGIELSSGFPLASLVGLFSDGNKDSVARGGLKTIFEIGAASTVTVPAGATLLALAFQDGYQWNNNTGSARVSITLVP
jgi:hypothetical protein